MPSLNILNGGWSFFPGLGIGVSAIEKDIINVKADRLSLRMSDFIRDLLINDWKNEINICGKVNNDS
jgi:hypothetical protein|tara:strand:- start:682 stop:882 length:201 start_codon:yes stop_codon:yes gene_type:complete